MIMNKGLEALSWLRSYEWQNPKIKEKLDTIETELKRLKKIETQRYLIINGARGQNKKLIRAYEKQNEILRIIKEKDVDIHNFKEIIIKQDWTYEQYLDEEKDPNTSGHQFAYKLLTKKEFDLLKEWLK